MLLLLFAAACDPIVIGLEDTDTTGPMIWTSRVPECVDGQLEVDLGPRWQFVQMYTFSADLDLWRPTGDGWEIQDNVFRVVCGDDPIRVSWVSLPE